MGVKENVQALLAQRGWSQRELAAAAGISPGAVGSILEGQPPNLRTMQKVAKAFGVTPSELLREDTPPEPRDELEVALRHQGDLSADDIRAVHAFISYIRDSRQRGGRREH